MLMLNINCQIKFIEKKGTWYTGFSMTMKTRPLVVGKIEEYFREKSIIINSSRLLDELFVFIYNNQRS